MKRLFSKRSGFTLVEIIIAFAIFAIMASMIVQVLNLMVQRKARNRKFEDNLAAQEEAFIARGKNYTYDPSLKEANPLSLQFKDNSGTDVLGMNLDFQLKNWDEDNPRNLVNYFVGDLDYNAELSFTEKKDPDDDDDDDEKNKGGSSQMSRFDTRLTGTKGIESIEIAVTRKSSEDEGGAYAYTVSVKVKDDPIDTVIKNHSQVTLYFPANVVSVNNNAKSESSLKEVKVCGENGVNVHCLSDQGFKGGGATFKVMLAEDVDTSDIGFGEGKNVNGTDITTGITYKTFKIYDDAGNEKEEYVNIFGAYPKAGAKPAE